MISTAREALLAEALDDLADLLARLESLAPAIDAASAALVNAAAEVTSSVEPYRAQVQAITERGQARAVEYIARRASVAAQASLEVQTAAMARAARDLFDSEAAATLRRLTAALELIVGRAERPWVSLATHAGTAFCSAAASVALVLYLLGR